MQSTELDKGTSSIVRQSNKADNGGLLKKGFLKQIHLSLYNKIRLIGQSDKVHRDSDSYKLSKVV